MKLFFRHLGSGEPLIILHGLYGSSDNWYTIGRELADSASVYLIDQRNHGNSPHHNNHNYQLMADDLLQFMEDQKIERANILGHSMGGKTALTFALGHPERTLRAIIVDISPLSYDIEDKSSEIAFHRNIADALLGIDPALITTRTEADRLLQPAVASTAVRQFLLKNLKRTPDGKFEWAFNMSALAANMHNIFAGIPEFDANNPDDIPEFPLLFIKGERSGYIRPHDVEVIRYYFPWSELVIIPNAGHWVHAEQPVLFLNVVRDFLGR